MENQLAMAKFIFWKGNKSKIEANFGINDIKTNKIDLSFSESVHGGYDTRNNEMID